MDPLDELDPLAAVFPEDDGLPPGGSAVDGRAATPAPERQALGVAFPVDALLAPVFRAFEQAGVRWCLLRLPEDGSSPGGEVVALVDRSALSEARRILKANGFAPFPTWGLGPRARFVGFDPEGDRWVTLDVVTRLNYGPLSELETGAEGGCLERRRWQGGVFVLAPDDAFWTLLLHVLIDGPGAGRRSVRKLERLAVGARADGPLGRLVGARLPQGWTPEHVIDCAWERAWEALERLAPVLAAEWSRQQTGPARRRGLANRVLRRIAARRLLPPARGLSVALLAPDAAAKAALARELGKTFYLPVTYIRMSAPPRRRPRICS